jgi:two-component sensor histidine kinase
MTTERGGSRPSAPPGGFRLSTQTYLLGLVAAVVIPLLAFSAFLVTRYAVAERARYQRDAAQIARQVALVIDAELGALLGLLHGLAVSSALANDDFATLHGEAMRLVAGRDQVVVLRDLGSRQFLNTQRPFGTALPPPVPLSVAEEAAFGAGRPLVSDVYVSPVSGETRIAVALPIVRNGTAAYVLALTVPTSRIRDALLQAAPAGWIAGVGDRKGIFVTRSARHEDITGKPGVPEYLAQATGRAGTFRSVNLEGIALLAGYYRSDFSGWLFTANVPLEVVEAPLGRSLTILATLGTAALALSALIAYLVGKGFTAATTRLVERAAALGEGRPLPPMSSRLKEFALVGDTLGSAAAAVEERARERKRNEDQLRLLVNELNHRVKNMLATVQSIAWHTLRDAAGMEEARNAVTQRLIALANVHDVLTQESWEGAELNDVVSGVIRPYARRDVFVLSGPPVWLTPALSLSLGPALNELATNAVKHGALSTDGGSVTVSWSVTDPLGHPRLTLRWIERGGPPVRPPAHEGFGSRLIQRSLSAEIGGRVTVDYASEGLACVMEAPLRRPAASAEPTSAR